MQIGVLLTRNRLVVPASDALSTAYTEASQQPARVLATGFYQPKGSLRASAWLKANPQPDTSAYRRPADDVLSAALARDRASKGVLDVHPATNLYCLARTAHNTWQLPTQQMLAKTPLHEQAQLLCKTVFPDADVWVVGRVPVLATAHCFVMKAYILAGNTDSAAGIRTLEGMHGDLRWATRLECKDLVKDWENVQAAFPA